MDRYLLNKQKWRDLRTEPTYRFPRRRKEAFQREFGQSIEQFDFSVLDEVDRMVFVKWLQGAKVRDFESKSVAERTIKRCFEVLRNNVNITHED